MNLKLGEFTFKGRFNYRRCRRCLNPITLRSNGRNNSKHCWPKNVGSYCVAKSLTGFKFFRSNSQQHPSTCNRVCERTQHAALNNVASVCTGLNVNSELMQRRFCAAHDNWKCTLFILEWYFCPNFRKNRLYNN